MWMYHQHSVFFRGQATTELKVSVHVAREDSPTIDAAFVPVAGWAGRTPQDISHQQQQQQQ